MSITPSFFNKSFSLSTKEKQNQDPQEVNFSLKLVNLEKKIESTFMPLTFSNSLRSRVVALKNLDRDSLILPENFNQIKDLQAKLKFINFLNKKDLSHLIPFFEARPDFFFSKNLCKTLTESEIEKWQAIKSVEEYETALENKIKSLVQGNPIFYYYSCPTEEIHKFIEENQITSPEIIAEYMQVVLSLNVKISVVINELPIQERHRLEIAKKVAANNWISYYIKNFGLSKEEDRLQVAIIAASKMDLELFKYLENYELSEKNRFALAKISAHINSEISEYLDTFKLATEEQRFEVAKIAAIHHVKELCKFIKNYQLSEKHRFELAQMIVTQHGLIISDYIENFDLSEEQRYEVAKILALQNSWAISYQIEKYQLLNEEYRLKLAKIVAAQDGRTVSSYIKNFHLSEKNCYEVAKIAMVQDMEGTFDFIDNYAFTNKKYLFEILQIPIRSGQCTLETLQNFLNVLDQEKNLAQLLIIYFILFSPNQFEVNECATLLEQLPFPQLFSSTDLLSFEKAIRDCKILDSNWKEVISKFLSSNLSFGFLGSHQ